MLRVTYLCDSECVVEVTEGVELPFLPLDSHEELLDALERQLVTLHQDPDRVRHELAGHLQDLVGKCGRDQAHLNTNCLENKENESNRNRNRLSPE